MLGIANNVARVVDAERKAVAAAESPQVRYRSVAVEERVEAALGAVIGHNVPAGPGDLPCRKGLESRETHLGQAHACHCVLFHRPEVAGEALRDRLSEEAARAFVGREKRLDLLAEGHVTLTDFV